MKPSEFKSELNMFLTPRESAKIFVATACSQDSFHNDDIDSLQAIIEGFVSSAYKAGREEAKLSDNVAKLLRNFALILRMKNISPPMLPGVQNKMCDEVMDILAQKDEFFEDTKVVEAALKALSNS
jgi:hypothetical protein